MDLVLEPSYRKLWRLMRERHLKKKDLQKDRVSDHRSGSVCATVKRSTFDP